MTSLYYVVKDVSQVKHKGHLIKTVSTFQVFPDTAYPFFDGTVMRALRVLQCGLGSNPVGGTTVCRLILLLTLILAPTNSLQVLQAAIFPKNCFSMPEQPVYSHPLPYKKSLFPIAFEGRWQLYTGQACRTVMRLLCEVHNLNMPIGHVMKEQKKFLSFPSLTLCFHPNSRTFVCPLLTYAKNRLSSSQKPTFQHSTLIREMDTGRQKTTNLMCNN